VKKDNQTAIHITKDGDAMLITFPSPCVCDADLIAHASQEMRQHLDAHHPQQVIFDFDRVKFFSSQVLGLILEARAWLQTWNGQVMISSIDPKLHRTFRITHLDHIVTFSTTPHSTNNKLS
jgi:anti-anti-sigma factor